MRCEIGSMPDRNKELVQCLIPYKAPIGSMPLQGIRKFVPNRDSSGSTDSHSLRGKHVCQMGGFLRPGPCDCSSLRWKSDRPHIRKIPQFWVFTVTNLFGHCVNAVDQARSCVVHAAAGPFGFMGLVGLNSETPPPRSAWCILGSDLAAMWIFIGIDHFRTLMLQYIVVQNKRSKGGSSIMQH